MSGEPKRRRGRPRREGPGAQRKNVTVDAETLVLLQTVQEQMALDLGFRPTLAQTVQRLIATSAKGRAS